ncbi:hypothetical protein BDP27DRAFT_1412765 [Rhodocollybia butyracea]|uniref:F-box domain-containing protein n=1 Tax=Rhodocollybia butyracea TaxID=206335 RepID=A0A9P5UGU7_9AGAR|nr:hypothetical protein BDP27DRAFT_1412765 [Rhodocollybia butyracea]
MNSIPVELVCHILHFLAVQDLLQCNLVCRRFRKVINDSSALQFAIELSRCRMVSALPSVSEPPFSSRLRTLRNRENAWMTFSPSSRHKINLANPGRIYEFASGVYGTAKEINNHTASITFYDLPSIESGQQRSLTHSFTDLNVVDFTIDPAQDLIVLVSLNHDALHMYDLHLRTLSSNEPHPKAPSPVLSSYKKRDGLTYADGFDVRIQVFGETLGFLVKEEALVSKQGHFEIFRWLQPIPNSSALSCFSGIDDFTFLSEDHFLLVRPVGLFEVYHFSEPFSNPSNPAICGRYALPALSDGYSFWYLSLSSNPSPGYYFPGSAGEKNNYCCTPTDRLHACCMYVYRPAQTDRDTVYPFVFFFHPKTFLNPPPEWQSSIENDANGALPWPVITSPHNSHSSDQSSSSAHSSPSSVSLDDPSHNLPDLPAPQPTHSGSSSILFNPMPPISFEVWGPQNTRWFRECLSKDWQHSVYGLRTVDCILDRAALEGLLRKGEEPDQNDSDDEFEDDEPDDDDDLVFINDVAVSAGDIESYLGHSGTLPKFIRIRDFNPYSISKAMDDSPIEDPPSPHSPSSSSLRFDGREIADVPEDFRGRSGYRRVITGPSKLSVRGIFRKNIISCLPYVEVISEETYNVNQVMMDDRRLLLIKEEVDEGNYEE